MVTTDATGWLTLRDALQSRDVTGWLRMVITASHGHMAEHERLGPDLAGDLAAAILAAMPDWVLMPRVATADWTGSGKPADAVPDAERAARRRWSQRHQDASIVPAALAVVL